MPLAIWSEVIETMTWCVFVSVLSVVKCWNNFISNFYLFVTFWLSYEKEIFVMFPFKISVLFVLSDISVVDFCSSISQNTQYFLILWSVACFSYQNWNKIRKKIFISFYFLSFNSFRSNFCIFHKLTNIDQNVCWSLTENIFCIVDVGAIFNK